MRKIRKNNEKSSRQRLQKNVVQLAFCLQKKVTVASFLCNRENSLKRNLSSTCLVVFQKFKYLLQTLYIFKKSIDFCLKIGYYIIKWIFMRICSFMGKSKDKMQKNSRQITLKGCKNTRDLGGVVTMDGKTVAPCKIFRSGALRKLSKRSAKKFK